MAKLFNEPGHGKNTWPPSKGAHASGGVPGMAEHDFNAAVTDEANRLLKGKLATYSAQPSHGYDVPLSKRTSAYNAEYKKDNTAIGVSNHGNASSDKKVKGFGVFYWKGSANGKKLAQMALAAYKKEFPGYPIWGSGIFESKVGDWTNFAILRDTAPTFILIEWDFFTNDDSRKRMLTDDYRKRCGKVLASVACDWYGIKFNNPGASISSKKDYYLSGDAGAEVKKMQMELVKAGYKLAADGIFGVGTESAVKKFQKDNKLAIDGVWGKASQAKLDAILTESDKPVVKPPTQKPKETEKVDLKQWQKEELKRIFEVARDKGIFSSDQHEKDIVNDNVSLSQLIYLQTVIAGAALNGNTRIK